LAKNLKINIKNTQIAQAIKLGDIKNKLAQKKSEAEAEKPESSEKTASAPKATSQKTAPTKPSLSKVAKTEPDEISKEIKEEAPRIRARSKSAFGEGAPPADIKPRQTAEESSDVEVELAPTSGEDYQTPVKSSEELRKEIFGEELPPKKSKPSLAEIPEQTAAEPESLVSEELPKTANKPEIEVKKKPHLETAVTPPKPIAEQPSGYVKLGPTGRHVNDLLPKVAPKKAPPPAAAPKVSSAEDQTAKPKAKVKGEETTVTVQTEELFQGKKGPKVKEFRDVKPTRRADNSKTFDARDRHGLRSGDEEQKWRKKRAAKQTRQEEVITRPTAIKVRIPISIKDLAAEMKLKAAQLIAKLFLQGIVVTLNDLLDDPTTIQLLGQEFGCEVTIDTAEEERIRITDKTIREEVAASDPSKLITRAPVVAFMGHVDHGKTSLIDAIRKSNRAAGEAGAITQHIGAFRCSTPVGDITILDTPGHEAFSAMRARGADVTDIVVLVVAGDEGMRQQTIEAMQHARNAGVTIVVAINKSDKPNFNPENVYRQLSEQELLPEAWGGQTITVNCSAVTGAGIKELLEMLALQAEVLELKVDPTSRARGTVLESEMHKGMGSVATVLVQNGTLRLGDSMVFEQYWGRVKTMQDEYGHHLTEAPPSTPVAVTGLSGLPEAGQEFIVVKNEREAREIADARQIGMKQSNLLLKKRVTMENLVQQASEPSKKTLNIVLRADVQGSLEALRVALMKIESKKVEINIVNYGVGEVSESDVQLASASKAVIIGFHTQIESHADSLIKQLGIEVRMHDIIYHAIDDVKELMRNTLDKIAVETDKGKAVVKATFKSSHHGIIAGCGVTEGSITRNNHIRVVRNGETVWKGTIASLKRVKEDVREVQKGVECGILINNFSDIHEGDVLEAYEVTYIEPEI
jgi:translation initiation factor IF-2